MVNQKRGKNVALFGAGLQSAMTAMMVVIWLLSNSLTALAMVWLAGGGIPLWLLTALLFYTREMARLEERELAEIAERGGAEEGLFTEGGPEQPAAARAAMMDKWVTPIFTILWAGYHVALGVLVLRYLLTERPAELLSAGPWAFGIALIGFVCFLLSRYVLGMSTEEQWRLHRATGSYLFVNCLLLGLMAAAFGAASFGYNWPDYYLSLVVPALMFLLAAEVLINQLLDIYRPRLSGQEIRPSYDSRLWNLLATPSRVGNTLAEAINYQFGFEVSKTWFYELLSKAILPLLVLAAAILIGMSSIVIVHEGQRGVVERWGRADFERPMLEPGLHLKWPWPVDTVERFLVGPVQEIFVGAGAERSEEELEAMQVQGQELYLWSQEHGRREELDFIIAVSPRQRAMMEDSALPKYPPVNLIKLVAVLQYRIVDVRKWGYDFTDPVQTLESLAQQQMTRYAASATLFTRVEDPERPQAIMTTGKHEAARKLQSLVQQAADEVGRDGLGVKITYLGFTAVHPPPAAAEAYEEVLEAKLRQNERIYQAKAVSQQILGRVAGDPTTALRLSLAIQTRNEHRRLEELAGDPEAFVVELKSYIENARNRVGSWRREVQRELEQGRLDERRQTTSQAVLKAHLEHLQMLQKLLERQEEGGELELGARLAQARRQAESLFEQASGQAARALAEASADRWTRELLEKSRVAAFRQEYLAFQASPRIYMLDKYLDVMDDVLPGIRKYVVGVDRSKVELRLDLREEGTVLEQIDFGQGGG